MSDREERSVDMEKRLHDALVAAGLKEDQLQLIATEPHVAKDAADAIRTVLDRRSRRDDAPRSTAGDVLTDDGFKTPFW